MKKLIAFSLFAIAAAAYPAGGTAMFALLALAGDVGCGAGPGFVGLISDRAQTGFAVLMNLIPSAAEAELKVGMLFALLFPIGLLCGMKALKKMTRRS